MKIETTPQHNKNIYKENVIVNEGNLTALTLLLNIVLEDFFNQFLTQN